MAFPGTYNINYYKGDTFEFRIYPKDNAGNAFSLTGFSSVRFTISNRLGESEDKITIEAFAEVDSAGYVLCAIRPEDALLMEAGRTYVYDVEIKRVTNPYDYVYTLLSGSIVVTEEVTKPSTLTIPNQPGPLTASDITSSSITVSWTAPTGGPEITGYKVALLSNPLDPTSIIDLQEVGPEVLSFTFTPLPPETTFGFGVVAYNAAGDSAASGTFATTLGE
jgi:hypothetical protein